MSPQRLMLVRHGETDWNAQNRAQGLMQVSLNDNGHYQAAALAAYLGERPITAIYSSDLDRALQTAEPLSVALGIRTQIDERWREINLGIFQGLTYDEAAQTYPAEIAARNADFWNYLTPQGETRRALQDRAYAALDDVVAQTLGPETVIVTHGGTLQVLLWKLFGEDDLRLNGRYHNTSITTLEHQDGAWSLVGVGETLHLSS